VVKNTSCKVFCSSSLSIPTCERKCKCNITGNLRNSPSVADFAFSKLNFDYWMYGGKHQSDRNAAKAAGHELRGLVSYYNSNVPDLNFPLMALIDYRYVDFDFP
jgi:hypothetical protein